MWAWTWGTLPLSHGWLLQMEEKSRNLFWHLAICYPVVFCLYSWPFCCMSVSLLILIMEYNFWHEDSGSSLRLAKLLPEPPRRKANGKAVWLKAVCYSLPRTPMGSFHVNVTAVIWCFFANPLSTKGNGMWKQKYLPVAGSFQQTTRNLQSTASNQAIWCA